MSHWTEAGIRETAKIIGTKKFLLAQRSSLMCVEGTSSEQLSTLVDIARATENEAPCATAIREVLLEQIDASIEGIKQTLLRFGVAG